MKQSSKNNQPDKLTIEEVETFITHNAHTFGATKAVQLAKQLAEAMAMENCGTCGDRHEDAAPLACATGDGV